MTKIKVGFLPLYIQLYDDTDPAFRVPCEAYAGKLTEMLTARGLELVKAPICRTKDEFDAAAELFNCEQVTAVITYHLAYSPSLESIGALLKIQAPLIVLDTTPDLELVSAAAYDDRIMNNHGIHGVQDMCNLLRRSGRPYFLCVGHVQNSPVIDEAVGLCRAAAAAAAYRTMKVGSVGGSFTGMGDFLISDEDYRAKIGAEVRYMTPELVQTYLAKVTDDEVEAEIASDRSRYAVSVKQEENYRAATRSGLAVRKWMEDNRLGSVTVNFLTLDRCGLPKMPFPECCKVLERGQGYAGEGDVLTAGLVGALLQAYPDTTFTEMFCPDWVQDVLLLSHMGESNPNLAAWKPHVSDKPFGYNSCGDTVSMNNCYRGGKVVYINLAPQKEGFRMIVTEGEMLDIGLENGAYGNATQGWFKPHKPLREFLKEYSLAGGTHHSAMIYGADKEEIKAFGTMMGFETVEI